MLVHEILKRGKDNNDAIYSQLGALTYQGLRVATENCRRRLYAMGVRQRSTVGIYSRNRAEYIAAYMAIVSLGAIVVPINFQLSMRETAFILKNADSHFLLTDKPLTLDAAINSQYYEDVKQMDIGTCIEPTTLPPPPELPKDFSPDEPAALIYTSGTTGEPKGAVLSHRNLVMNTIDLQQVVHYNSSDNVLCVLPMYHCFAWTCAVMISLYTGYSGCLHSEEDHRHHKSTRSHHYSNGSIHLLSYNKARYTRGFQDASFRYAGRNDSPRGNRYSLHHKVQYSYSRGLRTFRGIACCHHESA